MFARIIVEKVGKNDFDVFIKNQFGTILEKFEFNISSENNITGEEKKYQLILKAIKYVEKLKVKDVLIQIPFPDVIKDFYKKNNFYDFKESDSLKEFRKILADDNIFDRVNFMLWERVHDDKVNELVSSGLIPDIHDSDNPDILLKSFYQEVDSLE